MMNSDPVAVAARAAARHLSGLYGPRLELDINAALHAHRPNAEPARRYVDPVAVAGVIVSIATLAWEIYSSRRSQSERPTAQWLARALRIEHRRRQRSISKTDEEIIEIIAIEIIKAVRDDDLPAKMGSSSPPANQPCRLPLLHPTGSSRRRIVSSIS
jgi:hypothetical protein